MQDMYKPENKIILVLIILFAGTFGIHNFILGETKKGIVKIVLAFLCSIASVVLAFMDLIKIVKEEYTVNPDAFI